MSIIADSPPIPPLAVALGDPAGIGPEIVAKAWEARHDACVPPFFAVGDARSIVAVWDGPLQRIGSPDEALRTFAHALPLIQMEDAGEIIPGEPNMAGARCSLDSLELAVGLTRSGAAGALVTGPVSKAQLYSIGFVHPGQTEFVAERCGISGANAVMMLAGPSLRTVPVTTHVPLAEVQALLSIDLIVAKARATERGLIRNFGIEKPRLVIAGFNPHAGEGGALGREEIDFIIPAIEILRSEGVDVMGPLAADTMFHARARAQYDAAICLYHDQALIPLKTLHFDEGVNMTLGLPIVRTAPDHGTAFEIAGRDKANPGAMISAIRMAGEAAGFRCMA
ncbi:MULTISPECIES: 4-hydroxythreonine-4-phosphate dehydrogenase PdxA [Sphingomonadales]|uniref:4-hydroxythreonine-4-phosphate dehydrogenase n=1 Tax=Edaphosphingomonas haloaromaticamans TaxID=653954 RepID=A0A1S1HEY4_9SPHN|nr:MULTISPECIES: 4-hydroxythreonine-4-phosphate dehydrogenase PdxA [Sphingomonas]AGH48303.1 4-hydroxythreonine-4-phosphate dehydrogenase [Sphingomonas sp. MM-1]MDX3883488.1 4-hydroxythreonine-4-phosphate dehydrogenase PdxA [Sphingomonas sp.]OHT20775.1 4-hydroxythreonine-4-phosphate dehydrogenase [Sphingomonas haloaromaticamans]